MKKITVSIFFAQLITSPLSPLPNGSIPSTSISTLDSQEVDIGIEAPQASWWAGLSSTQKALIVGSGIIGSVSLVAWGMKKQGYSFFEKRSGEGSGKGTLSEEDNQTTTQPEAPIKIDKAEEARMRHMALPNVSFLIYNDERSTQGLTPAKLNDKEFLEANSKFYLILPLDHKIPFKGRSTQRFDEILKNDEKLSEQLAPFSEKLFLCDFSGENNTLTPVDLIPLKMTFSHNRENVCFSDNYPLLGAKVTTSSVWETGDIDSHKFVLENTYLYRNCIKWNNYYIITPQRSKE